MNPPEGCPICDPMSSCKGYPQLWRNLRRADGHRWHGIHATINGKAGDYPSVPAMLGNAAKAAVRFAASGFKSVDAAERSRRLDICRPCEHFDPSRGRCRLCGCITAWKARIEAEHCPVGKW